MPLTFSQEFLCESAINKTMAITEQNKRIQHLEKMRQYVYVVYALLGTPFVLYGKGIWWAAKVFFGMYKPFFGVNILSPSFWSHFVAHVVIYSGTQICMRLWCGARLTKGVRKRGFNNIHIYIWWVIMCFFVCQCAFIGMSLRYIVWPPLMWVDLRIFLAAVSGKCVNEMVMNVPTTVIVYAAAMLVARHRLRGCRIIW